MKLPWLSFVLIVSTFGLVLTERAQVRATGPTRPALERDNVESQPPTPTPAKSGKDQKSHTYSTNKETTNDKRGTQEQPLVIKSLPSQEAREHFEQERSERNEESANNRWIVIWTAVSAISASITALIAGIAACIAIGTLRAIKEQVQANIAAATAAKDSADAAVKQADILIASERAYIRISHKKPGVRILKTDVEDIIEFVITFEIRNVGKTSGMMTDVNITQSRLPVGEPLPAVPEYPTSGAVEGVSTFLYGSQPVFFDKSWPIGKAWLESETIWYVYGYIDYIDHFGQRHRAGYARYYDATQSRNNLLIVLQDGYNYDRPINRGDGNDWGSPN